MAVAIAWAVASAATALAPAGPREYGCPLFPANDSLNRDISPAPVDPRSAAPACLAIARDDAVGDEVRRSAAEQLAALGTRA